MDANQANKKTYYYTLNEIRYGIFYTSSGNNIYIEITNMLNPLLELYQGKFALENLERISSFFKMIKTLEQYDKLFDKIFSNQQFSLIKNQKEIILKISINIEIIGDETFELSIPKIPINNDKNLDYISNKFIDLENANNKLNIIVNELNDKVKEQEEKIKLLEKNNNELMERVIKLEKYNNEQKEKKTNKLFQGDNSKIIEKKEEEEFLKQMLPNKKFKLLYRATQDGDSITNFHNKVDNKGETITLFKTDKNRKFGGHISKSWNSNSGWVKEDASYFLFNLNEKKCYKDLNNVLYNSQQFYCHSNYGPDFYGGTGVLQTNKNCSLLGKGSGYESQNFTELSNITKDFEFSGEKRFTCVEIEVYKVIN